MSCPVWNFRLSSFSTDRLRAIAIKNHKSMTFSSVMHPWPSELFRWWRIWNPGKTSWRACRSPAQGAKGGHTWGIADVSLGRSGSAFELNGFFGSLCAKQRWRWSPPGCVWSVWNWGLNLEVSWNRGYLSHHPFIDGFSITKPIQLLGIPPWLWKNPR